MYKEIIIETTTEGEDFVSNAFFSVGVSGVKIINPSDINEIYSNGITWDYIDDKLLEPHEDKVLVSGFVSEEECDRKVQEVLADLADITYADLGSLKVSIVDYVDEDWMTEWKKHYKPIEIGDFAVVPEWIEYDNADNKLVIKIDPSMAFGTGEHESTKMCLALMSEIGITNKFVIDVGTGSGILGIGAIKKGAKRVYMCDIDSLSIKSARENSELNGVLDQVEIEESDLCSKTDAVAEVLLANLTAEILLRLAEALPTHLEIGGYMVCSGIIHTRKQAVIDKFAEEGMALVKEIEMGEWDALLLQRTK
ncbi:MAG: 50S ribosomal protein L11 methyltransferase [Bacillota bacterium]